MLKKYFIALKEETREAQAHLSVFGLKKEGNLYIGKLNKECVDFLSDSEYVSHIEESIDEKDK